MLTPQETSITTHRIRLPRVLLGGLLAMSAVAAATIAANPAYARQLASPTAAAGTASLVRDLRADLDTYLQTQGAVEDASAAALSVNLPGRASTIDVSAGTMRFGSKQPVPTDSLWQIGSNTKAFTSVLLLQLEAERRLSLNDTLGRWLPQYPQWRDVTISSLLHMTSGIPGYDDQPAFLTDYASDPDRTFSEEQLVGYVIGAPATSGYSYSNTNYILAEMIIEKATNDTYEHQLYTRIIEPLGLHDTYYRPSFYPPQVTAREPAGYWFIPEIPQMASLVGHDVSRDTLSWGRGAGGIISTTHDMTVWERALYGGVLLPSRQQAELESLVSMKTGQPIERTSLTDPTGFGLGVAQETNTRFGTFWYYEGATIGFRTLHLYFPNSAVIMAIGLNSQVGVDRIGALADSVYATLAADGVAPATAAAHHAGRP